MLKSKDLTFIGFSVKARKIIYGLNLIESDKKRKYLMLLCNSASDNTKKAVTDYAKRKNITILITQDILLEEIVNKTNCKSAALTDKNLATAVLENISHNFITFDGGAIL